MNTKAIKTGVIRLCVCSAGAFLAIGQSTSYSEYNMRHLLVPAGATATSLAMPVEVDSDGGGAFDVRSASQNMIVSLLRPDNSEVTLTNASTLGYSIQSVNMDVSGSALLASPELSPGFHVRIEIPISASAGLYRIKVQNPDASPVLATILYRSNSQIRIAGVLPDGQLYVNQKLVLGCLVLQGQAPLAGATVNAQVFPFLDVTSSVSLSNLRMVSQINAGGGVFEEEYLVDVAFSGGVTNAELRLTATAPEVQVLSGMIVLGTVAAGNTIVAPNTITIRKPATTVLSLSSFRIRAFQAGTRIDVALTDSGPDDDQTGDGLYSGSFTPSIAGGYEVKFRVDGTGPSGQAYSRSTASAFQVETISALVTGTSDSLIDDNSDGKIDRMRTVWELNVVAAGTYRLWGALRSPSGARHEWDWEGPLTAGSQFVNVDVSSAALLQLGDGAYARESVHLIRQMNGDAVIVHSRTDLPATQAVTLANVYRGAIYFTGQHTITGIVTVGPNFDFLRYRAEAFTPATSCSLSAALFAEDETLIDFIDFSALGLSSGNKFFDFDFSGVKISDSGKNGPYRIRMISMTCDGVPESAVASDVVSGPLTASQFTSVPRGITLTLQPASVTVAAGRSVTTQATVTTLGAYSGITAFSASGLPAGGTATWLRPEVSGSDFSPLNIATLRTTPPGAYPVNIGAIGEGVSANANLSLIVTPPENFSLSLSSTSIPVAPASSASATVSLTAQNGYNESTAFEAVGLPAGITASFQPTQFSGVGSTVMTLSAGAGATPGTYPFSVRGTAQIGSYSNSVSASLVVDANALPSPWQNSSVGSGAGTATHSSGVFSMQSQAGSVGGTSDSFQFLARAASGDATYILRVQPNSAGGAQSRAGLMLRDGTGASDRFIFVGYAGGNTLRVIWRSNPGAAATAADGPNVEGGYWIRIRRVGNTFTAESSAEGFHWNPVGSPVTVALPGAYLAGMALCADSGTLQASFDRILFNGAADFYLGEPTPALRFSSAGQTQSSYFVPLTFLNSFSSAVSLATSGLPVGANAVLNPTSLAASGFFDVGVDSGAVAAGVYPFSITATSGAQQRTFPAELRVAAPMPTSLPNPWVARRIGVGPQGTYTHSNGSYQLSGEGLGLAAASDAAHFAFVPVQGDFTFVARVASVLNLRTASQFGIGVRQSLAPDSPQLSISLSGGSALQSALLTRSAAGTAIVSEGAAPSMETPWLRITRAASQLSAFISADGATWLPVGPAKTVSFGTTLFLGAYSASGEAGQTFTAVFDSVAIVGPSPDFQLTATPLSRTISSTAASLSLHSLRLNAFNEFNGVANLSVTGTPAGMTASLDRASISPGQSANLRLNTVSGIAPGTYPLQVQANAGALSRSVTINVQLASAAPVDTPPWTSNDIGAPITPGTTTVSGDAIAMQASGSTFGATSESFRLVHQQIVGDFDFRTKFDGWTRFDSAAAGIMARESLHPDAPFVCLCVRSDIITPTGVNNDWPGLSYRSLASGAVLRTEGPKSVYPQWLRLQRRGNLFSAWYSNDNFSWFPLGAAANVALPNSLLVGVAATSGRSTVLHPASFSGIVVTGDATAAPAFSSELRPAVQQLPTASATSWFTLPVEGFNGLTGPVTFSATGLPAGVTSTSIGANLNGQGLLSLRSSGSASPGSYPITLQAQQGAVVKAMPATLNLVSGAASTLPTDWSFFDFGTVTASAGPTFAGGVFRSNALGCCWNNASDLGRFVYLPFIGDGSVVARLPAPQENGTTQAGIAIRANHSLTSAFVMAAVNTGSSSYVISRSAEGASVAALPGATSATAQPYWMRLTRTGNSIAAHSSLDGLNWTQLEAPLSAALPVNSLAGLVSTDSSPFDEVVVANGPSFYVVPSPREKQVAAGTSTTFPITVAGLNGFSGTVSFSLQGSLPAGITGSFSTSSASSGGNAVLSLTASAASNGNYDISFTSTDGVSTRSGSVRLVVTPFSISVTPLTQDFGGRKYYDDPISYNITVSAAPGFSGSIALTSTGSPSSTNNPSTFSPATLNGSGSSVYTVNVRSSNPSAPNAYNGTYPITIRGTSGGQTVTTQTTLVLKPMIEYVAPSPVSGGVGDYLLDGPTLIFRGGYAGAATMDVTGVPSGVNLTYYDNPMTYVETAPFETQLHRVQFNVTSAAAPGAYPIQYNVTAPGFDRSFPSTLTIKGFNLSATPASRNTYPGSTAQYTLSLAMVGGYNSSVAFSVLGLPSGASAAFSPASRTTSGNSTVTVSTTAAVAPGSYPLTFVGTGPNSNVRQAAPVTLIVAPDFSVSVASTATVNAGSTVAPNVTVNALGGFTGAVTLSVSGLPAGVTAGFATNPVNGSGSSALSLSSAASTVSGVYPLVVTGTSGSLVRTANLSLTVRSFTVAVSSSTLSLTAGAPTTSTLTLTMQQGFNSSVTFSATGLPAGVTAAFSPTSRTSTGASTITLTATTAAVPGVYSVSFIGTSGSLAKNASAELTVAPGFSLSNGGNKTVSAGSSVTNSVTLASSSGLAGATSFTVSGLPSGITGSFSPSSLSAPGSTTLTLASTGTTVAGVYPITVTGTNGSLSRTTSFNLTVRSFTVSISPTSITATKGGAAATTTLTLNMQNGFNSSVAFSGVGVPAGVSLAFSPTSRTNTGTSTVSVTASGSAVVGTYTITLRGINGAITKTVDVALTVN